MHVHTFIFEVFDSFEVFCYNIIDVLAGYVLYRNLMMFTRRDLLGVSVVILSY